MFEAINGDIVDADVEAIGNKFLLLPLLTLSQSMVQTSSLPTATVLLTVLLPRADSKIFRPFRV